MKRIAFAVSIFMIVALLAACAPAAPAATEAPAAPAATEAPAAPAATEAPAAPAATEAPFAGNPNSADFTFVGDQSVPFDLNSYYAEVGVEANTNHQGARRGKSPR